MSLEERLAHLPEIKDSLPKKEVAFAFIKPDFLTDLPQIKKILQEHGLEVVYTERVRPSPEAVDYMYRDHLKEHFYPAMRNYLINHEVIILMVSGPGLEAQKVLLALKKEGGKDGVIRERLRKKPLISPEDRELWQKGEHPRQDEISIIVTQENVVHTADTAEEALESLRIILGDKFETMKKKGNLPAELWELFDEQSKSNQN